MRGWTMIPVLGVALLAGCGSNGDDESTTTSPPETADASSASAPAGLVARTFLKAGKAGHGEAACSLMTPEAVSNLAQYVVQSTGNSEGNRAQDCAEYFVAFQTSLGGALPNLRIGTVSVSGSTARAEVVCPACNRNAFPPLRLRRTAPGWRVDFDYRQGY